MLDISMFAVETCEPVNRSNSVAKAYNSVERDKSFSWWNDVRLTLNLALTS